MRRRLDMGRIHDGFYAALFHSDPEQANSLYMQLMEKLRSLDSETKRPILLSGVASHAAQFSAELGDLQGSQGALQRLFWERESCAEEPGLRKSEEAAFLPGHSLGGALAVIFAAALLKNHADVAARVSSVYTFGMPRVGDAEFCDNMSRAFPGTCHRISHAADIIPLVCCSPFSDPPSLQWGNRWQTRWGLQWRSICQGAESFQVSHDMLRLVTRRTHDSQFQWRRWV